MQKRTKIIATIGPASGSVEMLTKLAKAGMNVCRLNFSHGSHETHAEYIQNIRAVSATLKEPLTILQDLQGPKIRVANVPEAGVALKDGEEVVFTTDANDAARIQVDYADLHAHVTVGQRILMDDGLLEAEVLSVDGQEISTRIVHGGQLLNHKGLNLPGADLPISSLTEKDREDLRFGVGQRVDWVALSFVRSPDDVKEVRELIHRYEEEAGLPHEPVIRVMAKVEKAEAIEHLEEIVAAFDGIMVARGDLGIETAVEKVPMMQKQIVATCLKAAKPVVVATQMLDSMIRNPRPTRAEVSDIANAVIDHADATMLSGETTTGKYPLEAVEAMTAAICEAEGSVYDDVKAQVRATPNQEEIMTNVASVLAVASSAKAIIVASLSGQAVRFVSRERPEVPIFAVTTHERVAHQLYLSWGVLPIVVPESSTVPALIDGAIAMLCEREELKTGDQVIIVAGEPLGKSGMVNLVEVRTI